MNDRAICVHGHFYQPPRENPWTGLVDREPSAAPWDNWNERITDECYAPNTAALVHEPGGGTSQRNNFASISFNVGPTLMAWLDAHRPAVHEAIVAGDAVGSEARAGHGGAFAQVHDHLIMPLATPRDQRTQVRWGLADFRHRFGRPAAGMWLPETAVDVATLEALAADGVRFTVLAPHQAKRIRSESGEWIDADSRPGGLDTGRAYRQRLPSGREITLLFYDGELALGIAFDGLLHDGADLTGRLENAALAGRSPRLAHVATDGESYGHHHPHGEMALAWALGAIGRHGRASLTTYGAWLAEHPATRQVEVAARTSWSCAHGVRRWAGGCDCGTGGPTWDYGWRAALRKALDALHDDLAARFEQAGGALLRDPWAARDDYAELWLGEEAVKHEWWDRHLLPGAERSEALRWLDMQRSAMRMFTSCGWFFDDPAGLETRQVLRYAGRALDLAGWVEADGTLVPAAESLLEDLADVRSNRSEEWNAAMALRAILRRDRPRGAVSRPGR